jgi:hypothetical protein
MSSGNSTGRGLKAGWMAIMGRFGDVQTLVILGLFYSLLLGPAWFFVARKDPLARRGLHEAGGVWLSADSAAPDIERVKRLS